MRASEPSEQVTARYEAVVKAAKTVLSAFRDGRKPTEYALSKLEGAIDGVEATAVCGHRFIDDCYCSEDPS